MDADPDSDPDPAIFVNDLQDASKKLIFNAIFSAYYFLKVHLHHFSKIKSQKESQNSRNQGFSYYFGVDPDPDPDPAIFVIDLQDTSKKLIFNAIFSAYYFLKVHLHHFSKIKSKKVTK